MKVAYLDCFAGASGDMIVGAMLDAGLDGEFLKAQLSTLGIEGLDIKISRTKRAGLRAISFQPVAADQHEHRNLEQITGIIKRSKISEKAAKTAIAIFDKLARAEGTVHDKDPEDVHFHEVGAVDSIVDIVSASIGIDALGVEKVYCSSLSVGGGTVQCAHGLMPVPAPATAELVRGVPIAAGPMQAELLTPTGAAILTSIADEFGPLPAMQVETVGCGAGTRDPEEFPNILRLILGRTGAEDSADTDVICLLETNVDDVSGELIGSVTEELFGRGALDVFTTPIVMKHNRPAVQVSIICTLEDAPALEKIILEQGLTFGIRRQVLRRSKLAREFVSVETQFGEIGIKTGSMNGKIVNAKPEFSECAAAAKKHKVAVKVVWEAAIKAYGNMSQEG
ncbi:MAG: nickel pincer cofactor biosynthesis protein LarC [Planctomycetota bacterium]